MPELDSEAVSFVVASESFAVVQQLERRHMETLHLAIRYQRRKRQFPNPQSNLRRSDGSCTGFGGCVIFVCGVGQPPNRQGAALVNQGDDPFNQRISGKAEARSGLEFARGGWQ